MIKKMRVIGDPINAKDLAFMQHYISWYSLHSQDTQIITLGEPQKMVTQFQIEPTTVPEDTDYIMVLCRPGGMPTVREFPDKKRYYDKVKNQNLRDPYIGIGAVLKLTTEDLENLVQISESRLESGGEFSCSSSSAYFILRKDTDSFRHTFYFDIQDKINHSSGMRQGIGGSYPFTKPTLSSFVEMLKEVLPTVDSSGDGDTGVPA